MKPLEIHNAVNLTKQESIVFFCFKESVLWISDKRKTEAHLRRVASAFFLVHHGFLWDEK